MGPWKWICSFAPFLHVFQTGEDHEIMEKDSHFCFMYFKLERTMGTWKDFSIFASFISNWKGPCKLKSRVAPFLHVSQTEEDHEKRFTLLLHIFQTGQDHGTMTIYFYICFIYFKLERTMGPCKLKSRFAPLLHKSCVARFKKVTRCCRHSLVAARTPDKQTIFPCLLFVRPSWADRNRNRPQRSNLPTLRDFIVIFKRQEICL
jgi:hypothetical protein